MDPATSSRGGPARGRGRALPIAAALALLCALSLLWVDGPRARAAVLAEGAVVALRDLSLTAGLRDGGGRPMRAEPFPVTVVQEGGPRWIAAGVSQAVAREGSFAEVDAPNLLRISSHVSSHAMVIDLRLWRQGWDVRGAEPVRLHFAPWLAPLAGLLGVAAALASRRASVGVLAAGLTAQVGVWTLPRPGGLGYAPGVVGAGGGRSTFPAWLRGWGHDPLLWRLEGWLARDTTTLTAVLGGVLAMSLVLVVFDHRRSMGAATANAGDAKTAADARGISLPLALTLSALYAVGAVTWIDAAARTGLGALWRHGPMAVSLVALAGAWLVVAWRGWNSGRA